MSYFFVQKKINELMGRNNEVEQENKRLYAMLKQLSAENKLPEQNARPVSFENKQEIKVAPDKNLGTENVFQAFDLRLSAFTVTDNNFYCRVYSIRIKHPLVRVWYIRTNRLHSLYLYALFWNLDK